jgi:hypothetical protein
MAIQTNALATLRQKLLDAGNDAPTIIAPPAMVKQPIPYVDNRTVTPYLAISLEGITIGDGKEKTKLPRYAVFYSDAPGKIWVTTSHPNGTVRELADFEVWKFAPNGILSLNETVDNKKAQLLGGIDGEVLYKAMLSSYDMSFYVGQGYITLDCVVSVIDNAQAQSELRHGMTVLLTEAGMKPNDAINLGWVGTANDMRNPAYTTVIPTNAPIKTASPTDSISDSVPDSVPDTVATSLATDLKPGEMTVDTVSATIPDTTVSVTIPATVSPTKPNKPAKVPA